MVPLRKVLLNSVNSMDTAKKLSKMALVIAATTLEVLRREMELITGLINHHILVIGKTTVLMAKEPIPGMMVDNILDRGGKT